MLFAGALPRLLDCLGLLQTHSPIPSRGRSLYLQVGVAPQPQPKFASTYSKPSPNPQRPSKPTLHVQTQLQPATSYPRTFLRTTNRPSTALY